MKKKAKRIIFFDGDGTLWFPIKTKHTVKPHWVYNDKTIKDYHKHIMVIPTVKSTLVKLKKMGIVTVILSTHPHPEKEAYEIINRKVKHFNLVNLFTEIHATREFHESKSEYMIKILKRLNIPKSKALMVGDNYLWDYKPARSIGVEALLVKSDYMKKDGRLKVLFSFSDILEFV